MANVVVNDNHLTYGGISYFRGGAELVELGSDGEKRTPLTKMNYLEVKDRIPAPHIGKVKATPVVIDFTRSTKSDFGASVPAIIGGVPVNLSGEAAFEKLKKYELSLMLFSVPNNQMKDAANESPDQLRNLDKWGQNARIVLQLFVVVEATIATQLSSAGNLNLSVGPKGLQAEIHGGTSSQTTTYVPIHEGTGFAYLLAKIDWNKGRTRIEELNDDQWSFS